MTIAPTGFTVFCDDVRHEASGKLFFVGAYSGVITIHTSATPVSVPTFGFAITLMEPHELVRSRDFPVPFSIFLPGDSPGLPSMGGEFPDYRDVILPLLDSLSPPAESDDDAGPRMLRLDAIVNVAPLVIKEAGWIRVRAQYQDATIRLGSLKVEIKNP
jgi:hypothetical protein